MLYYHIAAVHHVTSRGVIIIYVCTVEEDAAANEMFGIVYKKCKECLLQILCYESSAQDVYRYWTLTASRGGDNSTASPNTVPTVSRVEWWSSVHKSKCILFKARMQLPRANLMVIHRWLVREELGPF